MVWVMPPNYLAVMVMYYVIPNLRPKPASHLDLFLDQSLHNITRQILLCRFEVELSLVISYLTKITSHMPRYRLDKSKI